MRRWYVLFLATPMIILLVVFTGWNPTSAEDQTVDFRLNQIMVRLNQIEWELSRVRSRQGTQSERFDKIDTRLNQILEEIESVTSTVPTSSSSATDAALVGTWRLSNNDFLEGIPKNIRRYLEAQADQADRYDRADRIESNIEDTVGNVLTGFEDILDNTGLRLIRFRSDGLYTDSTENEGMWLLSGDRLILATFNGRTYPFTYFVDGDDLTLTITGDQLGTLFKLEAAEEGRLRRRGRDLIDSTFKYTDRVSLVYTMDF